ncbi:hypothetical protein BOX15_Mlig026182g1 [Macrostomum lignano]|uniref:Transglutaminase-like domain-containing protein n=1 Tax=Macrostomum lignano TaxID=282301 RepID=A0A267H3A9_9PLAT|nr:hypothetical protein BOX15_Mlig026182g1 [Macrostomum lignano]
MSFLETLSYYRHYRPTEAEIPLQDYALDDWSSVRERLQSGQYPTPQSLATSQRKLGQPPREDQQQLDDVRQPPTPPFPPRRTKAELLLQFQKQPADIVTIDAQSAEELPQPDDSWASLCQRLYGRCSGDLERLRAAFGFVCAVSNRPGRLVKTESELQMPVYRTLRRMEESTGSTGEDRHSEVFAKLLSEAGIPFQRVLGYKKGAGLAPGFRTPVGGSWFACFVRGEWRLVDIDWAAMAADTDSREFFFLTDPEQFVITHLPCQLDANSDDKSTDSPAVWQLLARPLTKSEFDRMPVYLAGGTAGEFERHSGRLAVLNWPWNVVLGRPGELLELELRETHQRRHLSCRYTSVLRCLSNTIDGRQPGDCSVSRPIRTDRDGVLKFKVEPPWPGKFYLEIRLLTEDDDYQYDDCFVGFVLHCPVGCGSGDGGCGFPSGELSEFGPPRSDSSGGSLELGCDIANGELSASNGEAAVALMHIDGDGYLRLTCRVYQQGDRLTPPGTAYLSRLGVHFYAPAGGGQFALVLRLRDRPVCQFLVAADCGADDADGAAWRQQPQPNWQRLVESAASGASKDVFGEPYKATTAAELYVPVDTVKETVERVELLRVAWRPRGWERRRHGGEMAEAEADLICSALSNRLMFIGFVAY